MDCDEIRPLLEAHALGSLSTEVSEAVSAHLDRCLPCTRIWRDYRRCTRRLDDLLRDSLGPPDRAPDSLRSNLRVCLRCMEEPETFTCPRLARRYMRLAPFPPAAV